MFKSNNKIDNYWWFNKFDKYIADNFLLTLAFTTSNETWHHAIFPRKSSAEIREKSQGDWDSKKKLWYTKSGWL